MTSHPTQPPTLRIMSIHAVTATPIPIHPTASTLELLLRRTFGFLFCIRDLFRLPYALISRDTGSHPSSLIPQFVYLVDTLVCSLINNETNSIKTSRVRIRVKGGIQYKNNRAVSIAEIKQEV